MKWFKRLFEKKKVDIAPKEQLNIPDVIKSVCDHKAPRRIVFGEHRCSKCGMLIGHN
jgi:hypothetical protein